MRIALAQLDYHIGHFEQNFNKMRQAIEQAKNQNADLILFGELAVTGYPPRDFLEFEDFIQKSDQIIERLCALSQEIAIVVGAPSRNPVVEGKDLYNSAYFIYQGQVQAKAHKALLPTYDIFDEYRYFEPATEFSLVSFKGLKLALTICEDIWNVGNENPLYKICPMDELQKQGPDLMLNLSASPFSFSHAQKRIDMLKANVARYGLPIFYANHIGAQTEIIFDGGSLVLSPDGRVYDEMPYFEEDLRVYDLAQVNQGRAEQTQPKEKMALIHQALILGIRDYFGKLGLKKAILGLSGGIDSAVVAVLAQQALGAKNLRCLLLPSQFSSDHSINDARALAENLGIQYDVLFIEPSYQALHGTLNPLFAGRGFDVSEENLQARIRGTLLMAVANKYGLILLNTSNKSEAAVGYGTLYGDMAGGLSVIGDLYKTEVYALAAYLNQDGELIPKNIINKPPSAELRPEQKDSDSLPDYEVLDAILYRYIELRQGPRELLAAGFEPDLVARVLRLVNSNEFKRAQVAPTLRVSNKAFGMGRRVPIVGKYLS